MKKSKYVRSGLLCLVATLFWAPESFSNNEEPLFACGVRVREGEPDRFRCLASSGSQSLDAKAASLRQHLDGAFDYQTKLCFIEDSPPNAWSRSDRQVFLGRTLIREEFGQHGQIALAGVMAHEWAHQWQFKSGAYKALKSGVIAELQADCIAGYHIGRFAWATEDEAHTFARSLFNKGDYAFNSPSHHGTPDSRVKVMMAGFSLGAAKETSVGTMFQRCQKEAEMRHKTEKDEPLPVPAITDDGKATP